GADPQPSAAQRARPRADDRGGARDRRRARDERPPRPARPERRGGATRGRGGRARRLLHRRAFGTGARQHAPGRDHRAARLGDRGRRPQHAAARGDTPAVKIAATQELPGPAWGELPDVALLQTWPPTEPLPGVEVLVAVVARVGAEELGLLPDLRLVANYGVGYDSVDVAACRKRGIAVTNTPGVLDAAVADLTLALVLACRRQLVAADRFVREARWRRGWARPELLGRDLAGSTLGLVGMGRIGSEVARRADAFGMRVVHHRRSDGVPLDELLAAVDVVS